MLKNLKFVSYLFKALVTCLFNLLSGIKNLLFKNKLKSVQEAAKDDRNFCLDESLHLKLNHRYYSQVQFQMFVLDVQYCDFVICTDINKHRQSIFFDKSFSQNQVSKSE